MTTGKRNIDVGFIRSGEDMHLAIFNMPEDVRIRFTFWDYDAERLYPLTPPGTTQEEVDAFFRTMHDRMQQWNSEGGMDRLRREREQAERIRRLEDQVRSAGQTPVGVND